jgi:hypothetical protein
VIENVIGIATAANGICWPSISTSALNRQGDPGEVADPVGLDECHRPATELAEHAPAGNIHAGRSSGGAAA